MLNVREEPSTKSISKGYINTGIYNYIEQKQTTIIHGIKPHTAGLLITQYGWISTKKKK